MSKDKTTFELEDEDAALILKADGTAQFYLPHMNEDAPISDSAAWAVALGLRFQDDPEWRNELREWYLEKMREAS